MTNNGRRAFLKGTIGAVGGAALGSTSALWASPGPSAELVVQGGHILTMCDKLPLAGAMAIRGGRILAIGSEEQIKGLISPQTKLINLAGRSASPGLIDAHSHVIGFGQMQRKFVLLRPPKVNSWESLKRELAAAAQQKPAGEWIVGRGFDTFQEGRFPQRSVLDEAVPNHPVLIIHWGGQFGAANTLALQKADLLRSDVQDPYGGQYLRDQRTGLPNGVLLHYPAIYSVYQPALTSAEQIECAGWGMQQFASQGVTCVHDNFCNPRYASAYVRLEQTGRLPCRVRVYPYTANLENCRRLIESVRRYRGPLVRLQGIKLAVDGQMMMYNPPPGQPHMAIPMHPQEQLNEIVAAIHHADFQVDVHAVGDKGVDWTLAAIARAAGSPAECRRRRHRIEHFPFRKIDSIRRAAELGVPVCVQPAFLELKADELLRQFGAQGQRLVEALVPLRTFMEEGVHLAYGADVPAFPSHSPRDSIRCAMDRKAGSGRRLAGAEAVSFLEALRHHTLGSAYAAFDEEELGSLEAGKCADFVIWNADLRNVRTAQQAAAVQPAATYLAGNAVYEAR